MKNTTTPSNTNRPALIAASIIAFAILFNIVLSFRLGTQTGAWQFFARGAVMVAFEAIALYSILLIRRGKPIQGTWWLLGGLAVALFLTSLLLANIELTQAIIVVSLYYVITYQSLPPEQWKRAIWIGIVTALAAFLVDFLPASFRLPAPPEFSLPQQIVAGIVVLINVVLVWTRFRTYKMQNKFLVAILSMTIVSVAITGGYLLFTIYNNLTQSTLHDLNVDASADAAGIQDFLQNAEADALYLSRTSILASYLRAVESGDDLAAINTARAAVEKDFYAFAQARLIYDQVRFIDAEGLEIVRVNTSHDGISTIVPRSKLQNKADRGYFKDSIGLPVNTVFVSVLDLNVEQGQIEVPHKPVIRYATPVYLGDKLSGVIVTNILAENFLAPLGGGFAPSFLVDRDGYYLYHSQEDKRWGRDLKTEITVTQDFPQFAPALFSGEIGSTSLEDQVFSYMPILLPGEVEPRWFLANTSSEDEAFASANRALSVGLAALFGTLLVSAFLSVYLGRTISAPLVELTQTAETVAAGNLDVRANVKSVDEVGTLAAAFNSMTAQLQELIGTLEQRVADRTKALATSAEVSRRLSTILNQRQLVFEVVEQIRDAFNYYHAHIYLLEETSGNLIMAGGTGEAGQTMLASGHKVPKGRGLVGRAAETNQAVLVSDVASDPNWLPNPLLPETKSEIAVPISAAGRVLGVLDVQHNVPGGLRQEDADLLQSIANQVAIAMQNARSFEQSQRQSETENLINTISEKIQRATSIETVLQVAALELSRVTGAKQANVQLGVLEPRVMPKSANHSDRHPQTESSQEGLIS